MPMKHALTALAALAAGFFAATPAAAPAPAVELVGAGRTQALALASKALNDARAVQGKFLQIAPDGTATQGEFYLQRPGKLRFEYDPPAQMTIVADGSQLSVADRALKTEERYPLRATPLYFVLKNNIDLNADARVTHVIYDDDLLAVTMRDRKGQADGAITLFFDEPTRELRKWQVVDGTGAVTQVALSQVRSVDGFDQKLFYLKPPPTIHHR